MPDDRVRGVGPLQFLDLLVAEYEFDGGDRVLDVPVLAAPTIGAATVSRCSSQARATWARGTRRSPAMRVTASTMARSPSG
ncbi:hypothetical protein AQJ84_21580 [Streptomyces resistomycificus]|uniref:Uncharacterized protein n=1 Tax=Streptomyces resistomycificus TaxID=67356 RepID=A0A0L8LUQ3_9ACTN|nr:hypothetical protein ADK37_06815 [Streptomyces resistomycificus]KUN95774.1 hypothetical protein AQJ84_21580 [Streptomyces resistomycificus]